LRLGRIAFARIPSPLEQLFFALCGATRVLRGSPITLAYYDKQVRIAELKSKRSEFLRADVTAPIAGILGADP